MRRAIVALLVPALFGLALLSGVGEGGARPVPRPLPQGFFGIAPQSPMTDRDAEFMRAGGIESVRWPLLWAGVQPTARGGYDWSSFDQVVDVAARHGLRVLPLFFGTPRWLAGRQTTMPVNSPRARRAWRAFVRAAVQRYGPRGSFWAERAPGAVQGQPPISRPLPIRTWQVWNEANFFYFATPVSPQRFARLVKLTSPVVKRVDPGARIVLSGLFGEPATGPRRGLSAARFLAAVYRVPGIKRHFDGIALHPYAIDAAKLEDLVEDLHRVAVDNHDRPSLYITEIGWGSENNFRRVAFEQGPRGQVRQLRNSYAYLLDNRRRLNLKQVYWFSWKDLRNSCAFCDSVGFFREGANFRPKPAWRTFVGLTGGRARP